MSAQRSGSALPILLAVGVLVLIGAMMLFGGRDQPVQRSATGMQGLVAWLRANAVPARTHTGGAPLYEGEVGLRILPLYDTDLLADRQVPTDKAGTIVQTSEVDIDRSVVRQKIRALPTLVVLPKWRTGMRALGIAHRDLLIPDTELNRLLGQIGLMGAEASIARDGTGFVRAEAPVPGGAETLGLMHAQGIEGSRCMPRIGTASFPILLECNASDDASGPTPITGAGETGLGGERFWILADPDLIANHGLAWGENGAAFLAFVESLSLEKPVVLDLTTADWVVDPRWQRQRQERSWDDLARIFRWPFAMIWLAFAALGLLVLWRAAVRNGPVAREPDDEPMAAKITSIDAKARLLRLADHDVALLKAHIGARLGQLASEILGPHRPQGVAPMAALRPVVRRADPALAEELDRVSQPPSEGADLLGHLDAFENCIDRIRDEFGRTANPG